MEVGSMALRLEQCWEDDDESGGWYAIRGGGQWASIEGTAVQWREMAIGLRNKTDVNHRRCALYWRDDIGSMLSPRNAVGDDDRVLVWFGKESAELADQIEKLLTDCGEPCMRGDFDPIALGA